MKLGRLTLITHFLSILICLQINAQLSTNEIPIGFRYDFGRGAIPTVTMPAVDVAMLKEEVKMWMKKRLYRPVSDTMRLISSALKGHCNYYGVNGNMRQIVNFWKYVKFSCYRMLNRRDQKGRFRYDKFHRVWTDHVGYPHLPVSIWDTKPTLA